MMTKVLVGDNLYPLPLVKLIKRIEQSRALLYLTFHSFFLSLTMGIFCHFVRVILLPIFDILSSFLDILRMRVAVFLLPFPCTLASAFVTTKLLKSLWNEKLITDKAFTIFGNFMWMYIPFRGLKALMTGHTESDKIIHTVVLAYANRIDMVNIKGSAVLLRSLSTMLADFISFTNILGYLLPSVSIVDVSPAIVPMVFTRQPFMHMCRINKKRVGFIVAYSVSWEFELFATPTSAFDFCVLASLCLANLLLGLFRMVTSIERVVLAKLNGFLALFGATCNLLFDAGRSVLKCLSADDTNLLYWHIQDPFALGYSPILCGRLVTNASLVSRRSAYSSPSILYNRLDFVATKLGYNPEDEAQKSQEEDAQKLVNFSQGKGMPPAQPQQQMQQDSQMQMKAGMGNV